MGLAEPIVDLRPATIACTMAISALCLVTLAALWAYPALSTVKTIIISSDYMLLWSLVRITSICIMLFVYNAAFWLDLHFIIVSRIILIYASLGLANLYFTLYSNMSPEAMPLVYGLIWLRIVFMVLIYTNLRFALQRRSEKPKQMGCLFTG